MLKQTPVSHTTHPLEQNQSRVTTPYDIPFRNVRELCLNKKTATVFFTWCPISHFGSRVFVHFGVLLRRTELDRVRRRKVRHRNIVVFMFDLLSYLVNVEFLLNRLKRTVATTIGVFYVNRIAGFLTAGKPYVDPSCFPKIAYLPRVTRIWYFFFLAPARRLRVRPPVSPKLTWN